jgi:signal transduction histidine kinase
LVVKEALNNVARHAGASEVEVRVELAHNRFRVLLSDNGCGFNVAQALAKGRGLENMRSRLRPLGGSLDIVSEPGEGTVVTIEVALSEAKSNVGRLP